MVSETKEVCILLGRMEFRMSCGSVEQVAWFWMMKDGVTAEAEDWILLEYAIICARDGRELCIYN